MQSLIPSPSNNGMDPNFWHDQLNTVNSAARIDSNIPAQDDDEEMCYICNQKNAPTLQKSQD